MNDKKRAYTREWMRKDRANNPEKYRERCRRYAATHKTQKYAITKKWRAENRDKQRKIAWRQQGLPEPTRSEPKACECCGQAFPGKALCLDHCHITNTFRGWLCSNCNTGISMLGDTESSIIKALDYLQRTRTQKDV